MITINSLEELEKYKTEDEYDTSVHYDYVFKENDQFADVTFNIEVKLLGHKVAKESGKYVVNEFTAESIYAKKRISVDAIFTNRLVCKDDCSAYRIADFGGYSRIKGKYFECDYLGCHEIIADHINCEIISCHKKLIADTVDIGKFSAAKRESNRCGGLDAKKFRIKHLKYYFKDKIWYFDKLKGKYSNTLPIFRQSTKQK